MSVAYCRCIGIASRGTHAHLICDPMITLLPSPAARLYILDGGVVECQKYAHESDGVIDLAGQYLSLDGEDKRASQ